MSDKHEAKPPLNIPAGNSPITPDVVDAPPDLPLTGNKVEDYKMAVSRIDVTQDFKDMGKWPCTRNSLLYGIMSGSGIGAVRFLGSRSPMLAANWAVGTFVVISIASWNVCLRARNKELAQMRMIQEKFPHRHISNLKPKAGEWVPPPTSGSGSSSSPAI